MTEDNSALSVRNVSKTFKLPHERHSGLKQTLVSRIGGKHQRGYEMQHVLKNISFDVKKGEFFGIVGRNGSGKSTLLKLISGIYTPDSGSVKVNGSLTPFIELGVGFNPELSGRENVFLNGALMGFSRSEMEAKYDEIVEFAELSNFMDQKLKNYSSGMQVRLAFSIAIQSDSDILILDEVLAVGDEAFQRKCNDYFTKIKNDPSKTVILVTHGMENVRKYCDRALMLKDGEIASIGSPDDVASDYSLSNLSTDKRKVHQNDYREQSDDVDKFSVQLLSGERINQKDKVKVKVSYTLKNATETYIAVGLQDIKRNIRLLTQITDSIESPNSKIIEKTFEFNTSKLNNTSIKVMVAVYDVDSRVLVFNKETDMPTFQIRRTDNDGKAPSAVLSNNDEIQ